jgi:hypothetical protein
MAIPGFGQFRRKVAVLKHGRPAADMDGMGVSWVVDRVGPNGKRRQRRSFPSMQAAQREAARLARLHPEYGWQIRRLYSDEIVSISTV